MLKVNKFDLIRGFSHVVDLVNTTLAGHHMRVAYIAGEICSELGMEPDQRAMVMMASMLHDIGVIPMHEAIDDLVFESDMGRHAMAGYILLSTCPLMRREATVVRYHHTLWREVDKLPEGEQEDAFLGNLIHLADMIDVYIRVGSSPEAISKALKVNQGRGFSARAVEAASAVINGHNFFEALTQAASGMSAPVDVDLVLPADDVSVFSMLFSHVIDARSPFTATHSTGVAHLVLHLYRLAELPEENRAAMFTAGLLHDIGKLGVPLHLLEKPGKLAEDEFAEVSQHARISHEVLSSIPGFEKVAPWGAWHHEKLNGSGYPNGLSGQDIPMEARLMAVADILTAMAENRPYREGMPLAKALSIINGMAKEGAIDSQVVALVHDNIEEVNETRRRAQVLARHFFTSFNKEMKGVLACSGKGRGKSEATTGWGPSLRQTVKNWRSDGEAPLSPGNKP